VNPLLLPPRLLLRALDDLHTIARAAALLGDVEQRLDERMREVIALGERIEEVVGDGLEMAERIRAAGERIAELAEGVDRRLDEVLDMGERVVGLGDRVDGHVDGLDRLASAMLEQGRRVEAAGRDVAVSGRQIADALPLLERAGTMAEPLEGAVERLGRVVDRLPGGRVRGGGS
jgi:predicted nuclease with TOPRIM domain